MDGGNIAMYEHIECQRWPHLRGAALQRSGISSKHLLAFDMSIPRENYALLRRFAAQTIPIERASAMSMLPGT